MNLTRQLLMSSSFWVLNKTIVKLLGIETAFFLSNLVEAEGMMQDENGWFYQTIETVESITGLSRHSQGKSIDQLTSLGVISQSNRGMPMKRYFKINYANLNKLLCEGVATKGVKNSHTRVREIDRLVCENSATNKESSIKKVYKESSSKEEGDHDNNFKKIRQAFEQNGLGTISSYIAQELITLSEEYSEDWIIDAIHLSVDRNKRNLGYVKGILKSWKAEGKDDGIGGKEDDGDRKGSGRSSTKNEEEDKFGNIEGVTYL